MAVLINALLVSSPYIRLGIFDCGYLMMSRKSAAACLRYVSGVMAGKGFFYGKNSTVSTFLVAPFSGIRHL